MEPCTSTAPFDRPLASPAGAGRGVHTCTGRIRRGRRVTPLSDPEKKHIRENSRPTIEFAVNAAAVECVVDGAISDDWNVCAAPCVKHKNNYENPFRRDRSFTPGGGWSHGHVAWVYNNNNNNTVWNKRRAAVGIGDNQSGWYTASGVPPPLCVHPRTFVGARGLFVPPNLRKIRRRLYYIRITYYLRARACSKTPYGASRAVGSAILNRLCDAIRRKTCIRSCTCNARVRARSDDKSNEEKFNFVE